MSMQYLVLTDVDAIQRYVFSSVRMAAIVGASGIVRRFDDQLRGMAVRAYGAAHAVVTGGNGLFVFSDPGAAADFASQATREFRTASVSGTLTASEPVAFEEGDYQTGLRAALEKLDAHKRSGVRLDEPLDLGLAQQCEFCGSEPAQPGLRTIGGEGHAVGAACSAKLGRRDEMRKEQAAAADFNKLAGDDYLAIVVIDGDGLGDRLKSLGSPPEHEAFSRNVGRVVDAAREAAFTAVRAIKKARTAQRTADPFELLYQGGDDLVLACQARLAFPLIKAFSDRLSAENWQWAEPGGRIGFSVGVSVAHSGFPFRMAHAIASELLRKAKQTARQEGWQEGAIDFAVISEASGDPAAVLSERELCRDGRAVISLTGRPYRLASDQPHSLARLREACAALREFPRGRLFDLRNMLTRSAVARWGDQARIELGTVRTLIDSYLQQWESRAARVEELRLAWEAACLNLPVRAGVYPFGDLADAQYLWEASFGNLDSTEH